MESRISKRAQILKRLLKHINAKVFQDFGDHMVFGMEPKLRREEPAPLTAQDPDLKEKVDDALDRYRPTRSIQRVGTLSALVTVFRIWKLEVEDANLRAYPCQPDFGHEKSPRPKSADCGYPA